MKGRDDKKVPPMPKVSHRRPYDDDEPDGYLESDDDWFRNNREAIVWFLENAGAIRRTLQKAKGEGE